MPQPPSVRRAVGVVGLLALAVVGCGQTGEATTRIDEAEAEIEALTAEIVELMELEVTVDRPLGRRERCELVTGAPGASNRLSVRGPIPDVDDPLGRAGAVLSRNGYELIGGDRPDEVFGRRDGIRITAAIDPPTGQVSIDAVTACRALPE
jgi:hypothetical protein